MVRTRGRDSSIVRHGQPRCGVPTSLHGEHAIDLGRIPYSGLSPPFDGSPHGSHSSFPSFSTYSSSPSSSTLSSFHHTFRFTHPPSTLSPYHSYISSPPHPPISDPLMRTSSPYIATHPVSYASIAHHTTTLPDPSSSLPYVYHTSTTSLHPSFTSPPQPTPALF